MLRLEDMTSGLLSEYEESKGEKRSELEEIFRKINDALMKLGRVLNPVLYQKSGRYGHDPESQVPNPIPVLQPMVELGDSQVLFSRSLDPESMEFKALRTQLIRERNKVSDALETAMEIVESAIEGISDFSSCARLNQ